MMLKDILPVLRDIFSDVLTNCLKYGSKFRECSYWLSGLLLSEMFSHIYWILGVIPDIKLPSMSIVDIFSRLQSLVPADEYPIDLWLRCCFWSQVIIDCDHTSIQSSSSSSIYSRVFIPIESIVSIWIGCHATLFIEFSIIKEISFLQLHTFLLNENYLKRDCLNNKFCLYSYTLLNMMLSTLFQSINLSFENLSDTPNQKNINQYLLNSFQLIYSFMLTCVVIVYTRPISERSYYKELYRPIIEILDRVKLFMTHLHSKEANYYLEYPCIFASHMLSELIGGSLLMPLSQVESLTKIFELPLAFANNLEEFLMEHGTSQRHRDEPKSLHILLLRTLPHLIVGISFFSFSMSL